MDVSDVIAPTSEQMDAIDLESGPRVFTIERVTKIKGDKGMRFSIYMAEFPRPWRPGKYMSRALVGACGNPSTWAGVRVELYRDPDVTYGKETLGGIRLRSASTLTEPKEIRVETRAGFGSRAFWTVQPLADAPAPDYAAQIAAATTREELNAVWAAANTAGHLTDALMSALKDRAGELTNDGGTE